MSVTVRRYKGSGWEADIRFRLPSGKRHRERSKAPVNSKSAAQRWGEERERHLLTHGLPQKQKEVPTLREFGPRWIDGHARANQQKPAGIAHKETILRVHLEPQLGHKRLDEITTFDVQQLKKELSRRQPKTVNNVLTVLGTLLKKAVEWGVIDQMPCTVRLLKVAPGSFDFYDFDEFQRLVAAAKAIDSTTLLIVLLAGEAGLRAGEMRALQWTDVDLVKGQLRIERNEWQGHVTTTKGNRLRYVPMTSRLREALRAHRHLRGARVLYRDEGGVLTESALREAIARAMRRANLRGTGPHILRHTFCSHLAMRGAAPKAIQELAGHRDLATTMRYMHLTPAAKDSAIRLLDAPGCGDIWETGDPAI
jgi:integrase